MATRFFGGKTWEGEDCDLFVTDGKFVAPATADKEIDLSGRRLLPGFVDAHCHIIPMGLDLQKLHLGECGSHEQVLDALRDWATDKPDGWLQAVHYDQTKFPDSVHLTRHDLDRIVSDRPVILRHSNGHASVVNSAALKEANISEGVQDPNGGVFVRDRSGSLTGVLLERAHEFVTAAAPNPTLEEMVDAVLLASDRMSALGVTCASDMMTGRWDLALELQAYRLAGERGAKVRLRLYAQWGTVFGPRAAKPEVVSELCQDMVASRCRLAGIKIFADGAISSGTAAIYGEYTSGGNGQLIYQPERLDAMVRAADDAGWPVAIHSIGDRSTDHVMDAIETASNPSRHRIEHAMILSDAQIARLKKLGVRVTMQPEFLLRFGHAYTKQLGPERAATLKRARSVLDAGIPLSFSSDRPIVPGDPWDGINTAISRPAGFDPRENISEKEALLMYTKSSASVNDDEDQGAFEAGHFADFQVYEGNVLKAVYLDGALVS